MQLSNIKQLLDEYDQCSDMSVWDLDTNQSVITYLRSFYRSLLQAGKHELDHDEECALFSVLALSTAHRESASFPVVKGLWDQLNASV